MHKHRAKLGFRDKNTWSLLLDGPQCDKGQTCEEIISILVLKEVCKDSEGMPGVKAAQRR